MRFVDINSPREPNLILLDHAQDAANYTFQKLIWIRCRSPKYLYKLIPPLIFASTGFGEG